MVRRVVRRVNKFVDKYPATIALVIVLATLGAWYYEHNRLDDRDAEIERIAELTDQQANTNSMLICAQARLVAYVPAVQFEGEPLKNFVGWTIARQDMLAVVRERGICNEETLELLEDRVNRDEKLLQQLLRDAPAD